MIMKKGSTLFLKIVIVLIAIGVLAGLIMFPQTEGRAAYLGLVDIYKDPLIIFVYIGSTPFFIGLYQAFKLLNLIDKGKAFSHGAITTFKNMKIASITLIGFIVAVLLLIRFKAPGEDAAGPTGLGIIVCLVTAVIGTAAAIFQKLLQNAVEIKSENDLTV